MNLEMSKRYTFPANNDDGKDLHINYGPILFEGKILRGYIIQYGSATVNLSGIEITSDRLRELADLFDKTEARLFEKEEVK